MPDRPAWEDQATSGTSAPGALSPQARRDALARLSRDELDILVVGGGVTGAGAALDAATRGLKVGLVESRDLAAGTSSRSSKLIHGGLRYLEQLEFGLVREALRERRLLLQRLAPHLVRPLPFVYPLRRRLVERPYVGAGLALYDLLAGTGPLPRHRHLSHRRLLDVVPALRDDAAIGGIRYFDAQVDDSRLVLMLARTAAAHGAHVTTGTAVTNLLRSDSGKVRGAEVRDAETGNRITVRARHVIGAVGPFTHEFQRMAGVEALRVRTSKGVHITVPRSRIRSRSALITRTDRSVLFVIPWGHHWLIGTTDTAWEGDTTHPVASRADVEYLLGEVNPWLRSPLTQHDVVSVIAGLRPLVDAGADDTTRLSREHTVTTPVPGLTLIAGGKYTTYRIMARDVVDVVTKDLGVKVASSTHRIPLLGAEDRTAAGGERQEWARGRQLDQSGVDRLVFRYGALATEVMTLVERTPRLGDPIPCGAGYLAAEVVYAASHEGVLHLDDVMTRRTRIALATRDRGRAAAPVVAELIGRVLGWDDQRRQDEIASYLDRLEAEAAAESMPDDVSADAARSAWRDPRVAARRGP